MNVQLDSNTYVQIWKLFFPFEYGMSFHKWNKVYRTQFLWWNGRISFNVSFYFLLRLIWWIFIHNSYKKNRWTLFIDMADSRFGTGNVQNEPFVWNILSFQKIKKPSKPSRIVSKGFRSWLQEASTGQTWGNLSMDRNNNCNWLKHIKHVKSGSYKDTFKGW